MKHSLILILFLYAFATTHAQNIQLHYDFGNHLSKDLESRPKLTSTVEMFKPDRWGNTFFFVDMDYGSGGVQCAYWEIARELQFWKAPVSAHIEYNGGLWAMTPDGFNFNNAYLLGPAYNCNSADFSKGFSFMLLYKHIQKHAEPHNFQLTGTWYWHFAQEKCSFSGFADFWREKTAFGDFVFMSEPQCWLNLNKFNFASDDFKLSIGAEVELSHNFAGKGFYCIPTLAVKWSFD